MVQIVPKIRFNLRSWGFAHFTAQQLVYLHRFISGVIKIEAENEGQPRLEIPGVDEIRENIAKVFPDAFQNYRDAMSPPLEPDYFNCHYIYYTLVTTVPSGKAKQKVDTETFLRDFYDKNQIVQRFCHTVANLDRHGKKHRCSREAPNTDERIYLLLFWLATEYAWKRLKQSKQVNHETISSYWNEFTRSVDGMFGEDSPTSQSFRSSAKNNDSLLIRYREHINKCNETHLNLIFDAACLRGFGDFDVYPAYILSLGLDRALSFLNQEPEEIEVISNGEMREILAWRKIWTNFEDVEVDEYSFPFRG